MRYALMAVAEAKLMETAVMLPLNTIGGRYAISRVAPYTTDRVLWGTDYYRYHQALVCTELIKEADRAEPVHMRNGQKITSQKKDIL